MDSVEEVLSDIRTNIDKFFDEKIYLSYSAISTLLYSPKVYADKYIDKVKEEKYSEHLLNGKVIHCLLLTPTHFEEEFIVSDVNLPSGNTKDMIDYIYSIRSDAAPLLKDYSTQILARLVKINLHQTLKEDELRLKKIITPEAINYWNFLIRGKGKNIIDQETFEYCQGAVETLRNDSEILSLLGQDLNPFNVLENKVVLNEHFLQMDIESLPFGFKGILDNIVIDNIEKVIIINDFKTTSKPLQDFKDSVTYYNYWIQAIIYIALVQESFKELEGYTIKFNFIVIDGFYNYYIFKVTEPTLDEWLSKFQSDIKPRLLYHFENRDFNLPWELATKKLVL